MFGYDRRVRFYAKMRQTAQQSGDKMHFKSDNNRENQNEAQPHKSTDQQSGISEEEIKQFLTDIFRRYDNTFKRLKDR